MKKNFLSWLLAVALIFTTIPVQLLTVCAEEIGNAVTVRTANTTDFAGGEGTAENPYLIETKEHLNNVRNHLDAHYKMIADIVFTNADFAEGGDFYNDGQGWIPIGVDSNKNFTGIFDGNGHTIKGLYVNIDNIDAVYYIYASLFGNNQGTIANLGMLDSSITVSSIYYGGAYAGGIAGANSGTIKNCYNTGNIDGNYGAGGILGINTKDGIVDSCYNVGVISAGSLTGGIIGENSGGKICNCYNVGLIFNSSTSGGIVGENSGTIKFCYNIGSIINKGLESGGIVGINKTSGSIDSCYYWDFNIVGVGSGDFNGTINCTIDQMALIETYNNFDFNSVWTTATNQKYSFPILQEVSHVDANENTTEFAGGNGTIYDPYLIATKSHLNNMRKYLFSHFKIIEDIKFTDSDFAKGGFFFNNGQGWKPIGEDKENAFFGSLDGDGHTINGINIKLTTEDASDYAGLLGYNKGTIKNLGVNNGCVVITDVFASSANNAYAGGITGYNDGGIIENCYNSNNIKAFASFQLSDLRTFAGGIVGHNDAGVIKNCYNTGTVESSFNAGGITACNERYNIYNDGTIINCYNIGYIDGNYSAGGITASNTADIIECYNKGAISTVSSYAYSYTAGITGYNDGNILNCYNSGELSTNANSYLVTDYVGGIAAQNVGNIAYCFNTGNTKNGEFNGGIVGYNVYNHLVSIRDCFNIGDIVGLSFAGGIVGFNEAVVENSYNIGDVKTLSTESYIYPGGLAGYNSSGKITNCYSLNIVPKEIGNGNNTDTVYSVEQMKQQKTFSGFDFDEVWTMTDNTDYLYPELQGFPIQFKRALSFITSSSLPTQLEYFEGESLNTSGLELTLIYNNGTTQRVTSGFTITGYDKNKIGTQTITVTYQGKNATFTVTVKSKVPNSITSSTYIVSGGYISKIAAGTTVSTLINGINEKQYIKVYKGNAEVSGNTKVGTGIIVKLMDGSTVKQSITVVVTGDTNGDGDISITDMIAVKAQILGKSKFEGSVAKAADTNGDNGISITDFIQIKAHILGKSKIQAR